MKLKIKDVFEKYGYDVEKMNPNTAVDVLDKDIKFLAYDHDTNENVFKRVSKFVYKGNHEVWEMKDVDGNVLLRGSGDHRVYVPDRKEYVRFKDLRNGKYFSKSGTVVDFFVSKTGNVEPIVDIQIEGENYFTNDVLSHNTVWHCYMEEGVDDYKKIKDFIKNVVENSEIPYLTITPNFSVCSHGHGYLKGDTNGVCPICKQEMLHEYEVKLEDLKKKKEDIERARPAD